MTVSAGNEYFKFGSTEGMAFPASCPETVSVGAVFDEHYSAPADGSPLKEYCDGCKVFFGLPARCVAFSQRLSEDVGGRNRTDIFAPGFIMTSMGPASDPSQDKTRIRSIQDGTSQAAPVAAGVALLLQEYYRKVAVLGSPTKSAELPSVDLIEECLRNGGVSFVDAEDADGGRMDNVKSCGKRFVRIDAAGALGYMKSRLQPMRARKLRAFQAELLRTPKENLSTVVNNANALGGGRKPGIISKSKRLCLVLATTIRVYGSAERDINRIRDMVTRGAEAAGLDTLEGSPLIGVYVKNRLMSLIDDSAADEKSTLICYLKLHGQIENGRHVFDLDVMPKPSESRVDPVEKVDRAEILERLARHRARLTVLITESCSQSDLIRIPVTSAAPTFPTALFSALLIDPIGVVDINSSSYIRNGQILNQRAWMDADGAIFTRVLTRSFAIQGNAQDEMLARVRLEGGGRYSWQGFLSYLTGETTDEFRRLRQDTLSAISRGQLAPAEGRRLEMQGDQFPQAYALPE